MIHQWFVSKLIRCCLLQSILYMVWTIPLMECLCAGKTVETGCPRLPMQPADKPPLTAKQCAQHCHSNCFEFEFQYFSNEASHIEDYIIVNITHRWNVNCTKFSTVKKQIFRFTSTKLILKKTWERFWSHDWSKDHFCNLGFFLKLSHYSLPPLSLTALAASPKSILRRPMALMMAMIDWMVLL